MFAIFEAEKSKNRKEKLAYSTLEDLIKKSF